MESLHYGKILGEDRTNIGFCWEIATGIYYANLGVRGRGGWGCGAEHRQWRMQRGGAPAAVEKIEQASSAKIFSGTARRQGLPIGQGVHRRKSRCRDRNLNKQLFAQTAPPPLRGRGTGRGQMRLRLPWERICAQYGRCFSIVRIQHCKRQKGVRQGGICPP